MKNILRNCIYLGKNLCKDYGFLFWTLIYPIILVSFFYTAFTGIGDIKYEDINIGLERDNPLIQILDDIEMFNIYEVNEAHANGELELENIDGFVSSDLDILVSKSGINQSIIKSMVEEVKQTISLGVDREKLDFSINYIKKVEEEKANAILIIFYSLIAMVTSYSNFAGIETSIIVQANLTNIGARLNTTPLKKRDFFLSGIVVALVLNLLSNIILIIYIEYVLGLKLFTELKSSLLLILLGNLFGVSLGVFIGVSNNLIVGAKTMISIISTLFLSFLSGMMAPDINNLINKEIPILNKINPISIISKGLYRVNLLDSSRDLRSGLILLSIYSLVFLAASYIFLRRRNYDSI